MCMQTLPAESQTIPCNIVLLPSAEQSQLAIQASQKLAEQNTLFTLDDKDFYAHASLYMFQMSVADQDKCVAALQQLAERTKTQHLEQDGYFYQNSGHGKGYVDVNYARNEQVDSLQEQVISVFNELRYGMRESDKQKMLDATGVKLENLQKYGYPSVGELFRPHITLTKFPVETEPDLSVLPDSTIFDGVFTRIGLFEMGLNGTCIRKIAECNLAT